MKHECIKFVDQHGCPGYRFELDGPEGKGVIEITVGSYGLYITYPHYHFDAVALLDLFYMTDVGKRDEDERHHAIGIFDPVNDEDQVMMIRFYEDGMEVEQ